VTTLDDLLRAVCADPADDGARLAYADRCEEEGQTERAEFVRVQCELARIDREEDAWHRPYVVNGERVTPEPWGDLCRREGELLDGVCGLGVEALPVIDGLTRSNLVGSGGYGWHRRDNPSPQTGIEARFRRGFVESITCSCADWIAHGPAVVAVQPVTAVRLADAVIHQSGGNSTYYVGGLGMFPREYWRELENLPSRQAAHAALSAVCVRWARAAAGLPPCPLL
jgi:uncharacterized protein (TIGR02996 family)